jgi:ribosomal protein S18 acetylase RimI-like enzyme
MQVTIADYTQLDNPVYASLSGPHAGFALSSGRALRYAEELTPFMGLPAAPSDQDWRDALELVTSGGVVAVLGGEPPPEPWSVVQSFDVVQMVAEAAAGEDDREAVALGRADVPEMLELVAATQPGPFLERTIELGNYLGIRREGRLVAMAGERMRLEGFTELSAVCTAPAARGQGLATRLIRAVVAGIERRGERPFLHVMSSNAGAIRLYEELGFRRHHQATIMVVGIPARRPE